MHTIPWLLPACALADIAISSVAPLPPRNDNEDGSSRSQLDSRDSNDFVQQRNFTGSIDNNNGNITHDPNFSVISQNQPRLYVSGVETFLADCLIQFADQAMDHAICSSRPPAPPTTHWLEVPLSEGRYICQAPVPATAGSQRPFLQVNDVARRGESVTYGEVLGTIKALHTYVQGHSDPHDPLWSIEFLWQPSGQGVKRIWGTLKGMGGGGEGREVATE